MPSALLVDSAKLNREACLATVADQSGPARSIPRIVDQKRIDIVQIHSTTPFAAHGFIASLGKQGVRTVGDLQDTLFDASLFRNCDRVVCCSETTLSHAKTCDLPAEQLRLIPIPFAAPPPASADGLRPLVGGSKETSPSYICFVGDVTERKGIYELLSGFVQYRRSHPEERLVIAGPNHEGARFTARASHAGAEYLGPLAHREALALMQAAKLVIFPSKAEGLPRGCLEAIALGKRSLLPPGIPEFDRNCREFVLPRLTPEAIASKIEEALAAQSSPTYPLEEHDPRKVLQGYVSIYMVLLAQKNEARGNHGDAHTSWN